MNEAVTLNGKMYQLTNELRANTAQRAAFEALTCQTYGFDFENWLDAGGWKEQYLPYTLLENGRAVANVSVNPMEFRCGERTLHVVQLGTVMTAEDCRKQGLSRFLLERVLTDWEDNCDGIFLFANQSVLDFYPRFGFERMQEYRAVWKPESTAPAVPARRLDFACPEDRKLWETLTKTPTELVMLSHQNRRDLLLFYCLNGFAESLWLLQGEEAVVFAEYQESTLCIYDWIGREPESLRVALLPLLTPEIKRVELGFFPKQAEGFEIELIEEQEDVLFVRGEELRRLLSETPMRFPVLSHT